MGRTRNKTSSKEGGRSGVVIESRPENDNVDDWFDSAHSPEAKAQSSSPQDEDLVNGSSKKKNKLSPSRKKKVKTPKSSVRLSIGGESEPGDEQSSASSAKKYAAKVRKQGKNNASPDAFSVTSPDLSRVSTAPLSPRSEGRTDTEDEEEKAKESDDIETALLTQENEQLELDDETDVIARQASKQNTASLQVASPENDFPSTGFDGEDDDLAPPPLPDDMSNDDEKDDDEEEAKVESKGDDGKEIGGLESDGEKNDVGDAVDYGDDDDEGPGFNMVHDPETPLTVREERKKKELAEIQEERKRRKRENNPDYESDDEDNKNTPQNETKKSKKKKKNRRVAFSPKGIQIANRDYTLEPIGNFVEGSPEEGSLRRSKRARVKPLEFWRGEKMEYEAQNERGVLGQAMGDMPVVKAVRYAMDTPYKKVPTKKGSSKKGAKKQNVSNGKSSEEEEEFDSSKLQKKYFYPKGNEASLWDIDYSDILDQKVVSFHSQLEEEHTELRVGNQFIGKHQLAFKFEASKDTISPGHQSGTLLLPPKHAKNPESSSRTTMIFTVIRCQPKALEIAYIDPEDDVESFSERKCQRFLLSVGDVLQIPPGNGYRLENHSRRADALVSYTMIYPKAWPEE